MRAYLNLGNRFILLAISLFMTNSIFAQSYEYKNIYDPTYKNTNVGPNRINGITAGILKQPYTFDASPMYKLHLDIPASEFKYYTRPMPNHYKEIVSFPKTYQVWNMKGFTMNVRQTTNFYPFLMDARSASLNISYRKNDFLLQTNLMVNKYGLPSSLINQFGVNGSLTYFISPEFSFTMSGSFYSKNPYYSLATYPYISTNSYGGWFTYEKEKAGINL